jgi:hypothetical protein
MKMNMPIEMIEDAREAAYRAELAAFHAQQAEAARRERESADQWLASRADDFKIMAGVK